jgi:hypothetical protein
MMPLCSQTGTPRHFQVSSTSWHGRRASVPPPVGTQLALLTEADGIRASTSESFMLTPFPLSRCG